MYSNCNFYRHARTNKPPLERGSKVSSNFLTEGDAKGVLLLYPY